MQPELDFPENTESDKPTSIIGWIARSYEAMDVWKSKARSVFFTCNGDSNVSRNRVAQILRSYFLETTLSPETVMSWRVGIQEPVAVCVKPPKISASNSAYIDWLHAADYILLACASLSDQLAAENQKRESEFQSVQSAYNIRMIIYEAYLEIEKNSNASDEDILAAIQTNYIDASMANIKEARKQRRAGQKNRLPKKPIPGDPMPRYVALYF